MRTPAALALLLTAAAPAAAADLAAFLNAATASARPTAPLRADGELVTTSPEGTVRDRIAILRRPNGDVYLELHSAGTRALLPGDGSEAWLVPGKGKGSEAFALDAPFGGSEFSREDLRPFAATHFRSPTIVDREEGEISVSLTPDPSQYALQVITFDSEKKVPLTIKNYKDSISSLVKMWRGRGLTPVGGTWLPSDVSIEDFPMRTTSTLTLHWQPTADLPALFDPSALGKPSPLTWP